jgi:hypothetical protein
LNEEISMFSLVLDIRFACKLDRALIVVIILLFV